MVAATDRNDASAVPKSHPEGGGLVMARASPASYSDMELRTSTMVAVVYLDCDVNTETVYRYTMTADLRGAVARSSAYPVGQVVSLSADGMTRGDARDNLRRRHLGAFLHNSMSAYIQSTPNKRVHCGLSTNKIHLCGLVSRAEGRHVASLMLASLHATQARLLHINRLSAGVRRATLDIVRLFQGPPTVQYYKQIVTIAMTRATWTERVLESRKAGDQRDAPVPVTVMYHGTGEVEHKLVEPIRLRWLHQCALAGPKVQVKRQVKGFVVVDPTTASGVRHQLSFKGSEELVLLHYEKPLPSSRAIHVLLPAPSRMRVRGTYDPVLLELMLHLHQDYQSHEDWATACEQLASEARVIYAVDHPPPAVSVVRGALTNLTVCLPFAVDKSSLARVFEREGFIVNFDNQVHDHVSLHLPYESSDQIVRKKKNDSILVLIFGSGKVTITGPDADLNREAFDVVMTTVRAHELRFRAEFDAHANCLPAPHRKRARVVEAPVCA